MPEQTVRGPATTTTSGRPKTRKEIEADGFERVRRLSRRGVSGAQRHEDFSVLNENFGLVEPEIRPLFFTNDAGVKVCLHRRYDERRSN